MIELTSISDLPSVPAVYAMFGGQARSRFVAYVGLGSKLRGRIEQHLVRRDSSGTTGVSLRTMDGPLAMWWGGGREGSSGIDMAVRASNTPSSNGFISKLSVPCSRR